MSLKMGRPSEGLGFRVYTRSIAAASFSGNWSCCYTRHKGSIRGSRVSRAYI